MGKMDLKLMRDGAKFVVNISGSIDEDADFSSYTLAQAQEVKIDLNAVASINSCGIREWVKWINTGESAKVEYHNCPKVVVDQINMVDGFLPANGKVKSFYVPYYNEDSEEEKSVLFSEGKEYSGGNLTAPADVKDSTGNVMEMDVIEAKYFKFLKA